jgi:hypothetical protein
MPEFELLDQPRSRVRRWLTQNGSLGNLIQVFLFVVAIALVLSSFSKDWFAIPGPATNVSTDLLPPVISRTPTYQSTFQVLLPAGLALLVILRVLQKKWTVASTVVACLMLFVALTFPYFTMLKDPAFAADAIWLQMQHDNLTWLGGDIYSSAESGQTAWKSKVYWIDPPRQVAIAPLPTWSIWQIGLDKAEDLLIWTGYSNVFCQFVRKGWFYAVAGSSILLVLTFKNADRLNLKRAGGAIAFTIGLLLIASGVAIYGPFQAKTHLALAEEAVSQGNIEIAMQELEQCGKSFPALTQDTYFIAQKAELENKLGQTTDFAKLSQATSNESAGRYDQSYKIWRVLCDSQHASIRREAVRAILRFAIQDYNSQRTSLAQSRLRFVLQRQPGNVKAVYFLQILGIRENQPQVVYSMCERMTELTEFLNFNTTKILKAASQQNATVAAAQHGDTMETWHRILKAKSP